MKRVGIPLIVLILVFCSLLLLADGPSKVMIGTWKLDPAKSKYSGAVPKSQVAKLEEVNAALKVVSDRVEADGKMTHFEWTAKFNEMDYPKKGDPSRDTVSVKKINDYTLEI